MNTLHLQQVHMPLHVWRGKGAARAVRSCGMDVPEQVFTTSFDEQGFAACLGEAEVWLMGARAQTCALQPAPHLQRYERGDRVFAIGGADCFRLLDQVCSQNFRELESHQFSMAASMGIDAWFWRHPGGAIWLGVEPSYADYVQRTLVAIAAECGGDIEQQLIDQ